MNKTGWFCNKCKDDLLREALIKESSQKNKLVDDLVQAKSSSQDHLVKPCPSAIIFYGVILVIMLDHNPHTHHSENNCFPQKIDTSEKTLAEILLILKRIERKIDYALHGHEYCFED